MNQSKQMDPLMLHLVLLLHLVLHLMLQLVSMLHLVLHLMQIHAMQYVCELQWRDPTGELDRRADGLQGWGARYAVLPVVMQRRGIMGGQGCHPPLGLPSGLQGLCQSEDPIHHWQPRGPLLTLLVQSAPPVVLCPPLWTSQDAP